MRQVILFVIKWCESETKWVEEKLIEICCLQNQDQIFTVSLLDLLLKREGNLETGTVLTTKHIDILAMLNQFLASDDGPNALSLAQLSLRVIVAYMLKLEKTFGAQLFESKDMLVDNLLDTLVHFREANKVIYIRLFELGVEMAISSEGLCNNFGKPIISQVFEDFFEMLDILT